MKSIKILLLLITMTLIFLIMPTFSLNAFANTSGDYEYSLEGTDAIITQYLGSSTTISIPNTLDGYIVTSIGDYSFWGCRGLKSITFPNSVTSIGDHAFWGCSGLTNIKLSMGLTSIGDYAFSWCSGYSSGLTSISISSSVTNIGAGAFEGCQFLKSITIPNSVTNIGIGAFVDCTRLKSINVDLNNKYYSSISGVLYDKGKKTLITCPSTKENSFIIPNGVTTIDQNAFRECEHLTSITIPSSVISIGNNAFCGCIGLKNITIPNNVTSIGEIAFQRCDGLTSITIPNSVTSIGDGAFRADGLKSINVNLGNKYYSSISGVIYDKNIKTLVAYPRAKGTSFIIPNGVTKIGNEAFNGCQLTSIAIPSSVTSIGNKAFYGCQFKSITIPSSVTSIGNGAFGVCSELASIAIPNSVTTIGDYVFVCCQKLKSITIPNNVTYIGVGAFRVCSSLTSIIIPNSVTSIGNEAFYYCEELKSIIIPNNVKSIGNEAFAGCKELTIYGKEGSAAQTYANSYDITFKKYDYIVIFDSQNGSSVLPITTDYNKTIKKPKDPKRTGYTFAGWYNGAIAFNFATPITSNITLIAKWKVNTYTVKFNSNGGSAVISKSTSYNSVITEPTKPTKTGYTFVGWYTTASGGTAIKFPYTVKCNVTVYAHWNVAAPTLSSVVKSTATSAKLTYTKVSGVSGYEIWYSTSTKGFYSIAGTTTSTSYTKTKLTAKKKYYFKVRAYRLVNGKKVYSSFSVVKSVQM